MQSNKLPYQLYQGEGPLVYKIYEGEIMATRSKDETSDVFLCITRCACVTINPSSTFDAWNLILWRVKG